MLGAIRGAIHTGTEGNETDTTGEGEPSTGGVYPDHPDTVAAAAGKPTTYHRRRDDGRRCQWAGDTREADRVAISPHYQPCGHCFDDV